MDYLSGLNEQQKQAVLQTKGPLLILAGAGAGKTKTITHRILHLIREGVDPRSILAITFTNKAAKEMRTRVDELLSKDSTLNNPISSFERPFVSTFHSLGVRLIKENSELLNLPRHFSIFDRGDSLSAIKRALTEASLDPKEFEPAKILHVISKEKGLGKSVKDMEERERGDYFGKVVTTIWKRYEEILADEKALDFDDLLLKTLNLLKNNPEIREKYQNIFQYIHIDEYQDTNRVQYDTAKLLAEKNRNICVVGDIDQSIYSWRGADFKNIMRFEKDYPETKVILLEENYRSTKTILDAANMVIVKNTLRKEKNLFTSQGEGEKIGLFGGYDEVDEARFVAETAGNLVRSGVNPKDIGVLYRANFQSRTLEEAFLKHSVPYQVLGVRFFERKEIKDVLSYLRAALNPKSLSDIKRVINTPARGIGKVTLLKMFEGEEEKLPEKVREKIMHFRELLGAIDTHARSKKPSETLEFVIEKSGLKASYETGLEEDRERLENVFELVQLATKYDGMEPILGVEQLLSDAALASDQDDMKDEYDAVKLMTVHASKGLEFDYVFITGLEEDLFPHQRPDGVRKNLEESEEERRLFYVALTRARKKIYLCYANVRGIFGRREFTNPSSFLSDIDESLLDVTGPMPGHERGTVVYLE